MSGLAAHAGQHDIEVVDISKISTHWDDICRVAASVHTREVSAHDVIRVLQRDGPPQPH